MQILLSFVCVGVKASVENVWKSMTRVFYDLLATFAIVSGEKHESQQESGNNYIVMMLVIYAK